jgi:hypothetical protein
MGIKIQAKKNHAPFAILIIRLDWNMVSNGIIVWSVPDAIAGQLVAGVAPHPASGIKHVIALIPEHNS